MKNVFFTSILAILTTGLFAKSDSIPAYLKDAIITVTLKDGTKYTFSSNEYAVVSRSQMGNIVPPPATEDVSSVERNLKVVKPKQKSNRIRIMGGLGPVGIDRNTSVDTVKVSTKKGPMGGVGYDRLIEDSDVSVNGQIFTNGTLTIGIGLDL